MVAPRNPHPQAKDPVAIIVTQEELFILHLGIQHLYDVEDSEFEYIRDVAGSLVLPPSVVTYNNVRV